MNILGRNFQKLSYLIFKASWRIFVLGSWFLVLGSWFLDLGSWLNGAYRIETEEEAEIEDFQALSPDIEKF